MGTLQISSLGVIVVTLSVAFVISPFLYLRHKDKSVRLISDAACKEGVGRLVRLGMFLCGLALLFYAYLLAKGYGLSKTTAFFVEISAIALCVGGLITKKIHDLGHKISIFVFYIALFVGMLLYSFEAFLSESIGPYVVLLIISGGVGTLYMHMAGKRALSQVFSILFANLFMIISLL